MVQTQKEKFRNEDPSVQCITRCPPAGGTWTAWSNIVFAEKSFVKFDFYDLDARFAALRNADFQASSII